MTSRHLKAAGPIIRFAIWFLLVAVCYRNTQSAFFRAESGWYQFLSHSDQRQHFLFYLLTYRYQGHYTPLAFIGEFELTRLVGPHEFFWKWRQITVLSVLATAISMFTGRLARSSRISIVPAEALAGAITALFVFQPRMTDFIAWPFMVMQLEWLLLTVAALAALVQIAGGSTRVCWIWMAAACAYGSMHASGLGIATVGATGVACLLLLSSDYIQDSGPNSGAASGCCSGDHGCLRCHPWGLHVLAAHRGQHTYRDSPPNRDQAFSRIHMGVFDVCHSQFDRRGSGGCRFGQVLVVAVAFRLCVFGCFRVHAYQIFSDHEAFKPA